MIRFIKVGESDWVSLEHIVLIRPRGNGCHVHLVDGREIWSSETAEQLLARIKGNVA